MPLDHSLRSEEGLDLFAQVRNAFRLPHPFRALGTKAEALKTETNAGLTAALRVRLFVALLSPYPTGVAARLSAHCTFSFGRPGFLSDFSGGRSGGRGDVTANGWVVRHVRRRDKQGAGERLQGEKRKGRGTEEDEGLGE